MARGFKIKTMEEFAFITSCDPSVVGSICHVLEIKLIEGKNWGKGTFAYKVECTVRQSFRLAIALLRRSEPIIK